jgi:hypothetical protein
MPFVSRKDAKPQRRTPFGAAGAFRWDEQALRAKALSRLFAPLRLCGKQYGAEAAPHLGDDAERLGALGVSLISSTA